MYTFIEEKDGIVYVRSERDKPESLMFPRRTFGIGRDRYKKNSKNRKKMEEICIEWIWYIFSVEEIEMAKQVALEYEIKAKHSPLRKLWFAEQTGRHSIIRERQRAYGERAIREANMA